MVSLGGAFCSGDFGDFLRLVFGFRDSRLHGMISNIVMRFHKELAFEQIFFGIGNSTVSHSVERNLFIAIDREMFQSEDLLKIEIIRSILLENMRYRDHGTGLDFLDEIMIGNRIIREGFSKEYFVYNLRRIGSMKISSIENYLAASSLYIVFHRYDTHDYNTLKAMMNISDLDKDSVKNLADVIDMMHNDGSIDSIHRAAEIYNRMKTNLNK